jgi:hypothetical protein
MLFSKTFLSAIHNYQSTKVLHLCLVQGLLLNDLQFAELVATSHAISQADNIINNKSSNHIVLSAWPGYFLDLL